jgi:hypothetical protein
MNFEDCTQCGKKMIINTHSFAEARRAAFGISICMCPENKTPADVRVVLEKALKDRFDMPK